MLAPAKLFLASSNSGKLAEFRELAQPPATPSLLDLELLPAFNFLPAFPEDAPTFAENAVGKALHYSRLQDGLIFADDSGLVVPSLNGQPGVHSARYAGPHATSAERIAKLVSAMRGKSGNQRQAHFVCALALAQRGRTLAVITNRVDGEILEVPRGAAGFGYDPIFYFPPLRKTFAELASQEKNAHSHRGKAFRVLISMFSNAKS